MSAVGTSTHATNVAAARVAWDGAAPDWVLALAARCDDLRSQRKVGDEIGYSPGVVNQVLRNRYPGDLAKIEEKVRGRYMGKTVACPVLEEIPRDRCLQHQATKQQDIGVNPTRVRLWRACRGGCPHSLIAKGGSNGR